MAKELIKCPECGAEFELSQAISHDIENAVAKKYQQKIKDIEEKAQNEVKEKESESEKKLREERVKYEIKEKELKEQMESAQK